MTRESYVEASKNIPPLENNNYQNKHKRVITWGDKISKAKKGKGCHLAGWNKGLTKETNSSVAKIASNVVRNEKIRQAMIGRKITWKDKVSKTKLKQMQDPEYVRKIFTACGTRPNKPEKKLTSLLNKFFPKEWKYVGAGEVVLGGKCPDFINVNGHKWIIELNGEYWHRNDTEEQLITRINGFKKYGYDTLIIWTKELKDVDSLMQKIRHFFSVETLHQLPLLDEVNEGKEKVRT